MLTALVEKQNRQHARIDGECKQRDRQSKNQKGTLKIKNVTEMKSIFNGLIILLGTDEERICDIGN